MKVKLCLSATILCFSFFLLTVEAKTANGYSSKYINDFNKSNPESFDYEVARPLTESTQDGTKGDDNLEIYPDPEHFPSRLSERHDESIIKIYTTRLRQPKMNKAQRNNSTQDVNNEDLNGHDFIDSIMFIYGYYGKAGSKGWQDLGRRIVIIGCCFAIGAQILTIILVTLRNRRLRKSNAFFPITMNLLVMLFLSNLLFIVGVHSIKNAIRCEIIALILHYLYLTTSVWCFVFIAIIYDLIINEYLRLKMRFILLLAYVAPAIYVMFSYAAASTSLEYQKYCFMSIHKNMIINFLIPIFLLIVATTILGTICLKHIKDKNRDILDSTSNVIASGIIMNNGGNIAKYLSDKEILASYYMKTSTFTNQLKCCDDHGVHDDNFLKSKTDLTESKIDLGQLSFAVGDISESSSTTSSNCDYTNFKNATKFALFFQLVFAICWFIGVVALENIHSYAFPTIFAILYNILNWSILLKSRNILPFMKHFYESEHNDGPANEQSGEETEDEHLSRKDSKNLKNNKNLLNQLFLNSNTESSLILHSTGGLHRTDQIPLLYQNHRKSIANLELTQADFHFEKHKINSRSEHDLLFQQHQLGSLLSSGIENVIGCPQIRSSWDTNLDRVSTISN